MAFDIPLKDIVTYMLAECQLAIFVLFIIWALCRGKLRTLLSTLILVSLISSILFAFVFEPDLGAMDAFIFQKPEELKSQWNRYIDICVISFSVILIWLVSKYQCVFALRNFLTILFIAIFSASVFYATPYIVDKEKRQLSTNNYSLEPPEAVKKMFTFSKNGQNIVVLMLDMFTGGNMKQILEMDPSLANELDGFTWYPETMSTGSMTLFGLPSILGGEKLAAYNLLDKNRTESLEETINKEWANIFNELHHKNYEVSVFEYNWLRTEIINKYLMAPVNLIQANVLWDQLPHIWAQKHRIPYDIESINYSKFFYSYGLFKISPLSKKNRIYRHGKWNKAIHRGWTNRAHSLRGIAQLDSFSQISQVIKSTKNQFKFITNETTHAPWSIGESCLPVDSSGEYELNSDGTYKEHIQTEYCAIKSITKWINWMKEQEVYDNSTIIIVSDHGRPDSEQIYKSWAGTPPVNVAFHAVLLVKPQKSNGKLLVNNALTMNYDVRALIQNSFYQNLKYVERKRCSVLAQSWIRNKHPESYFVGTEKICLRGSLFNPQQWQFEKL